MTRLGIVLGWILGTAIKAADKAADWVLSDLTGRGGVAEHPDGMDEACALTIPTHRPVRVVRDYPSTPAERTFADQVENWMKEQVR
jgi:hypothetical protein